MYCFRGNSKICSFGYVITDESFTVLEKEDWIVNPKAPFLLTGHRNVPYIQLAYDREEFRKAPDFPRVYGQIRDLLTRPDSLIFGYAADNAQQEAGWIANEIARIHTEEDVAYRDIAIMYRANAQSRSLEEAMINANLPYQLVGGTKFYERREVKDAIAYLQAIVNPADNVNVRRILNVPKRGLGARAEGLVAGYADAHGLTFFESIEHMDQIEGMTGRTTKPLGAFRDLMHELADFAKEHDSKPSEVVAEVLDKSGLLEELQRSEDPQDASRVDNLSQLQSVAAEFEQNTPDATLAGFLETTALVADSDQLPGEGEDSGKVTMMTLHTAKGLEYPYVFLTGMEQGTFPHQRAMEDTSELSEVFSFQPVQGQAQHSR